MAELTGPILALASLAGALGALVRAEVGVIAARRRWPAWWATAAVNVLGAAGLGWTSVAVGGAAGLIVGAGLFGGLTTFSTWMVEAATASSTGAAARILAAPLLLAIPAALLGRALGS